MDSHTEIPTKTCVCVPYQTIRENSLLLLLGIPFLAGLCRRRSSSFVDYHTEIPTKTCVCVPHPTMRESSV